MSDILKLVAYLKFLAIILIILISFTSFVKFLFDTEFSSIDVVCPLLKRLDALLWSLLLLERRMRADCAEASLAVLPGSSEPTVFTDVTVLFNCECVFWLQRSPMSLP